ncbi:MAG: MauE/DoxX family redox-associated membrane protein [Ferruginibacter sp.]
MKKQIFIADSISTTVLVILLYTALSKLLDYHSFKTALSGLPILKSFSGLIAWLLPVTEILVSLLLFFPATRKIGLQLAFGLLTCFTIYLAGMIWLTPGLPCNCGGMLTSLTWRQHILFNLVFILLSLLGIILYKKHKETMKQTPP